MPEHTAGPVGAGELLEEEEEVVLGLEPEPEPELTTIDGAAELTIMDGAAVAVGMVPSSVVDGAACAAAETVKPRARRARRDFILVGFDRGGVSDWMSDGRVSQALVWRGLLEQRWCRAPSYGLRSILKYAISGRLCQRIEC